MKITAEDYLSARQYKCVRYNRGVLSLLPIDVIPENIVRIGADLLAFDLLDDLRFDAYEAATMPIRKKFDVARISIVLAEGRCRRMSNEANKAIAKLYADLGTICAELFCAVADGGVWRTWEGIRRDWTAEDSNWPEEDAEVEKAVKLRRVEKTDAAKHRQETFRPTLDKYIYEEITENSLETMSGNRMVALYLMSSYLYYQHNLHVFSDAVFDKLCVSLLKERAQLTHPHAHLITNEDLDAGTGFSISEDKYPLIVKHAAMQWYYATQKGRA